MTPTEKPRLMGVSMYHERGEESRAQLVVDRRLRSGKVDLIDLSEGDLVRLLAEASNCLKIIHEQRGRA